MKITTNKELTKDEFIKVTAKVASRTIDMKKDIDGSFAMALMVLFGIFSVELADELFDEK